ncbi:glutathione peroxidase [Thalassotalea sp. 1_MG-2023]|uniref:glutathione peroxidase n=1 Tax=Thalassotalea sp. 1_MG-2023 TaxID=3062680 RepID=UPI0026E12786|nr:glutathione peroxidase [Thalassotalea sp. 1_MG-2023]MDO6425525.1 glutathione peroxidase [Thalassotalea sp. 1_MG-2023]
MKKLIVGLLLCFGVHVSAAEEEFASTSCPDYLKTTKQKLYSSKSVNLCELTQGKPVLIVNTASNCGYTPHFKKLEAIHQKYQDQGLVVIGFPSDDFFQEEDDEKDTAKVCYVNYGVTFTMLSTSSVRGSDANDVFQYLSEHATSPKWNFYKYLVDANGETVKAFSPKVAPDSQEFITALEATLSTE